MTTKEIITAAVLLIFGAFVGLVIYTFNAQISNLAHRDQQMEDKLKEHKKDDEHVNRIQWQKNSDMEKALQGEINYIKGYRDGFLKAKEMEAKRSRLAPGGRKQQALGPLPP